MTWRRITLPVKVALSVTAAVIVVSVVLLNLSGTLNSAPKDTIIEHKYTSLIGDLADDIVLIEPSEVKKFNYTLVDSRDETGLMTGFIQILPNNGSGFSSVTVQIGNTSLPQYYNQFSISDGQMRQIDQIIPTSGSVVIINKGEGTERIMLNMQLTYFAAYEQTNNR